MQLRKGKTKTILQKSIDCAILAVEIYNKPRTTFRVQGYITQMIIAWTKLFHAYFHHTIGDKFYYKQKNGRYKLIDGERKAWDLNTCISKHGGLSEAQKANLLFFIKLRNKIEHRHIDMDDIGISIFGECQAMLYNFENKLIDFFGEEYAINESLAFSLQFSRLRTNKQKSSEKTLLSKEVRELKDFIDKYKNDIADETYTSQEYSIKLIQIPKISNTNRSDLAIEFVNWNSLSEEDRKNYEKVTTIIKDKVVTKPVRNPDQLKPSQVLKMVNDKIATKINHFDHKCLYYTFSIRPTKKDGNLDPYDTNTKYCYYDELHDDYVYQNIWVDFLISIISSNMITRDDWKNNWDRAIKLNIEKYEVD